MVDGCADTSATYLGNGFFEVSWTKVKVALVGFYDGFSNKYVTVGYSETSNDLINGTLVSKMNENPLLIGGAYSLLLSEHAPLYVFQPKTGCSLSLSGM